MLTLAKFSRKLLIITLNYWNNLFIFKNLHLYNFFLRIKGSNISVYSSQILEDSILSFASIWKRNEVYTIIKEYVDVSGLSLSFSNYFSAIFNFYWLTSNYLAWNRY